MLDQNSTPSARYTVEGFTGLVVEIAPRSRRRVTGGTVADVRVVEAPEGFRLSGWTTNVDHLREIRS